MAFFDILKGFSARFRMSSDPMTSGEVETEAGKFQIRQMLLRGAGVFVMVGALVWPVSALFIHEISDELDFTPPPSFTGGSKSVSMAAALLDREVNQNRWVANDPFFMPSVLLDNMPNYQVGIVHALGRFTNELAETIGRTRGSSQVDANLAGARGKTNYPGDVWMFDLTKSALPQPPSEDQYRGAIKDLLSYNERLASQQAIFDVRADSAITTLERISNDLGDALGAIEAGIKDSGGLFDPDADDLFYSIKGRTYAYYMLLRALKTDFAKVISEKNAERTWDQMLEALEKAAVLHPIIVSNVDPDDFFFNTHLASQGNYIALARIRLHEVQDIIVK